MKFKKTPAMPVPVALDSELLGEIDRAASLVKESRSAVMRMAIRHGLPILVERWVVSNPHEAIAKAEREGIFPPGYAAKHKARFEKEAAKTNWPLNAEITGRLDFLESAWKRLGKDVQDFIKKYKREHKGGKAALKKGVTLGDSAAKIRAKALPATARKRKSQADREMIGAYRAIGKLAAVRRKASKPAKKRPGR